MTTPFATSTSDSQMHNNIMAAGLRDRPPMLATGRYAQWRSWFLRYIDIRPNVNAFRKSILESPYTHSTIIVPAVPVTEKSTVVLEHTKQRQRDSKPTITPFESASEEDSDPEQAQRDKDIKKNLALISKYFKKIYKPTNNNLRTSTNSRNKNMDTTLRYMNDNQSMQFGNQRIITVDGARENVGSPVVQQTGIQCFNYKEFGHFAKECRKPKKVKDFTYHTEKMFICKQAEQGVPLQAEHVDWLADTDEKIDKQELEAHYSYMAKIQEVPAADSGTDSEPLEQV
nr:hypothetical protein [Tanacetum cinerariifolium]